MLPFQEQIISDLLEDSNGGVVVLSSGLPIHTLVASVLLLHHPSQGSLLILSASDSQKSSISRPNPSSSHNPIIPTDIPGDLPSHHRTALYSSGAVFFVTPRILIADLLTARVPPSSVCGLLILNAHRLTDTSTEAFIARILRSLSRTAYVRAFTDRPHAMIAGFAKAERIMKCLYVRRLHLWPRFHVLVSGDLEQAPPEVVDVRVPMTLAMRGIQQAVLETMDACLKELRKTNKVDVEDLTVENGLFKSFDEVVRRQLDPIWHTLGKKTKQLVSDLRTLRKLLDYLVRYDAVTYLKYLDTLRVSEGVRSVWIFAESSYKIFELAKKRVYQAVQAAGVRVIANRKSNKRRRVNGDNLKEDTGSDVNNGTIDANAGVVLEEVLEEAPKCKVLRVKNHKNITSPKEGSVSADNRGDNSDIILVVCKDERSCLQLEECIMKSPHQVMRQEWEKYLLGKAELLGLRKSNKKRAHEPKGFGILDGAVAIGSSDSSDPRGISKQENAALLAAASEISCLGSDAKSIPPIQFYALEKDERVLDIWRPSVIIVYHPDVTFVREIEVYKAENPSMKLKVYFLFYENSAELQKFEASIRRENTAFESLIRQKSLMMIPVDQDGRCIGPTTLSEPNSVVPQNSLTRKAGGRKAIEKEMQVIVDMREFMSSLPNVLHQKGMKIVPVVLEVGDYVLSPFICVERKSIVDLFQSFASGRLYHQVETMIRYYRIPVLLIEFSQDKSFSFQSSSDLGDDISATSIISKLSLLVLHFPRLRLVWSRSMHATAEIFASLKANQDEPDEHKAVRVGVPSEDGIVEDDVRAENYNTSAIELLRRLPGVTDSNYRPLMDGCQSLAELALLPVEKLAELMGGQKPAKMLREFLDAKCPTMP
ncbi:DNA repair endonuclease UVH1 [Apostasia shenzhenica]|uniref:DNA repair endonuclease UVH1 n=1 Tax=Apostasia shenzhenica TaxID=1088818 RepID=A0A2I0ATN2_9ASPA|nr:DNA repair endonuclease UVH1 [Apostasia shenzhenica]